MNKKEISLEELIEEMKFISNINNSRLTILHLHLYVEHFVHELYAQANIKKKNKFYVDLLNFIFRRSHNNEPSLKYKIKKLVEIGLVEEQFYGIVVLIYKLRNRLVHDLRPDNGLLEKWIDMHKASIKEDEKGLIEKFLKNTPPWEKIQFYAYPTIVNLYQQLQIAKGKNIDRSIIFFISPDAKEMRMQLVEV